MSPISVPASVTLTVPCEKVSIEVEASRRDVLSQRAREQAKDVLRTVYDCLKGLSEKGVAFEKQGMDAAFSIGPRTIDEQRFYEAAYSLNVVSASVDRATEIFDALASIEGVGVRSPRFFITPERRQELRNQAFEKAADEGKARFKFQCRALGVDPSDFRLSSWSYERGWSGEGGGKQLAMEEGEARVGAGRVSVTIHLRLEYERKKRFFGG